MLMIRPSLRRVTAIKEAGQVDFDHPVPVRQRHGPEISLGDVDASAIDQNVDAPMPRFDVRGGALHGGAVGDIQ
jgi:hypothetical protein